MRRFSRLEDVYNTLVAASFDFSSLPATNKYRKYKEWKQDPEQRKLPEGSGQVQGSKVAVGIEAFGYPVTDNANSALVKMSGRASRDIAGLGGNELYGLNTTIENYPKLGGFSPAKAHVAVKRGSGVAVAGTLNRITGQPYRSYTGESYTVPFGRVNDTDTEFGRQEAIMSNRADTHIVTFTPERLRRGQ